MVGMNHKQEAEVLVVEVLVLVVVAVGPFLKIFWFVSFKKKFIGVSRCIFQYSKSGILFLMLHRCIFLQFFELLT